MSGGCDVGEPDSHIILRVKFKRSATVAEVHAADYESDNTHLRAKDNGANTIADFFLDEVAGWWWTARSFVPARLLV
jgi:hypothetical protein